MDLHGIKLEKEIFFQFISVKFGRNGWNLPGDFSTL